LKRETHAPALLKGVSNGATHVKRFVQFLQAALACVILVALIFSVPVVMAATPIHLDFAFMSRVHHPPAHQSPADPISTSKF
jgi:hypothetical protein